MTETLDGAACGIEGCKPDDSIQKANAQTDASPTTVIEVISDAICPWCWVAKRRLERALAAVAPDIAATVTWKPFELNPDMPKSGLDRRTYRARKFGSWEQSQKLDAQVAAAAQPDGLNFRHDLMKRTPNTIDAHKLIWLAGKNGLQDAVTEALFTAYFQDGRDIGDAEVLIDIGGTVGLNRADIATFLTSDEGLTAVQGELDRARRLGVSSVPTVLVNGHVLFSGAIRSELMEAHLRRAAGRAER